MQYLLNNSVLFISLNNCGTIRICGCLLNFLWFCGFLYQWIYIINELWISVSICNSYITSNLKTLHPHKPRINWPSMKIGPLQNLLIPHRKLGFSIISNFTKKLNAVSYSQTKHIFTKLFSMLHVLLIHFLTSNYTNFLLPFFMGTDLDEFCREILR